MGKFYNVNEKQKREATLMETKKALKIQAERLRIEEVITNHQARLDALIGTCTHSIAFEELGHSICVACGKIKEPHEHA
jgi:3-deoxy-D-arabino-heptulosonate 7-phosphate (DAHP) synthase